MSPKKKHELEVFFDISLDLLCVSNRDGYFVRVNPAWERVLGYTTEELKVKPFLQFIHPEDINATKESMKTLESGKILAYFTNRYRHKDGTYHWLEWRAVPYGNMMYAAARDITERKDVEESLKERLLFEQLLSGLSARFVNMPPDEVDSEIEGSLMQILEFFQIERCGLIQILPDLASWQLTHAAYARGIQPPPLGKVFPASLFPYTYDKLINKQQIHSLSKLDDLPSEASADRQIYLKWGIRSCLYIPIMISDRVVRIIAIDSVTAEHVWPKELIPRLRLVGEIFADALERAHIRMQIEERLQFESLLAELSGRFVHVAGERVDSEINEAMQRICEHLGFDLAALWQWTEEMPPSFIITHLYRPLPGQPAPERMDAKGFFPWCLEQLAAGKVVAVSTDDLPAEASRDQEMWRHYEIKSSLTFPLAGGGKPFFGALGFNTIRGKRLWSETLVKRLQLVAEIFANALNRKNFEYALRESEERLSLASSSAGVGMWILDLSTRQFWATAKALELFGLPSDHALTFDYFINLVYPEDRELVLQAVDQASKSDDDVITEYRIVKADNSIRWMTSRGRKQLSSSGEVKGLMGVTLDITERKQAEAATAEAQSMISALVESTDDMIWSVDPERFGLLSFNSALYDYFMRGVGLKIELGMSPDDMVGEVFTAKFAKKWRQLYLRALREGPFTEEYITSAGTNTLLLSLNLLKRSGEVFGISVFGKDITEQKRVEAEASAARIELWRTDRLLRMGELTASLAHELNQPLTSILSNARAAIRFIKSDKIDMNELTEILEDIAKDDKRAGDIIRSLRSMLKPEEGELEVIEINDLLVETVALFNSEAIIRNIKIETKFADSLPPVEANRIQLQQVMINLLMNAAESMVDVRENKKIVVETCKVNGDMVKVAVHDYGTGIDEQELGRIFEPFFTTKRSGLGMGLSLVRSIIEGQAGHVWAENNPDRGATFYFELPASKQ